jgi:uncharacterized RDD family membrane protein YckC
MSILFSLVVVRLFDAEYQVNTPDQVKLQYAMAGIGSRALAQLIDLLLLTVVYGVLMGSAVLWGWLHIFGAATSYVIALIVILGFFIFFGYFILFEYFASGRTVGKWLIRLHVIRTNGGPLSFYAALIRNLFRFVDILPLGYLIGVITMLVTPSERRIGDFVADTIVVKHTSLARMMVPLVGAEKVAAADGLKMDESFRIEVKGLPVRLLVTDSSTEWQRLVMEWAARQRNMSKQTRMQLARRVWLHGLTTEQIHADSVDFPAQPRVDASAYTDNEIHKLLITAAKVFRKQARARRHMKL